MGAVLHCEVVDGKLSEPELRKWFANYVDECLDQYGHDAYNGTFSTLRGITVEHRVFENHDAARSYLDQKAEKWGDAVAVKYKDVRQEHVKEPTFNKQTHTAGWAGPYHRSISFAGCFTLRSVAFNRPTGGYENSPVPADELSAAQKEKIVATYQQFREHEKTLEQAMKTIHEVVRKIEAGKEEPVTEDYKRLKAAIKIRTKATKAAQSAAVKLKTLDDKLSEKLYQTADKDHGLKWLVLGVCAE